MGERAAPVIGLLFALIVVAGVTLGFAATAIWCLFQPNLWIASLVLVPFIAVMVWLTRVTWRVFRGIPEPDLLQPDKHQPDVLIWRSSRARAVGSFLGAAVMAALAVLFAALIPVAMLQTNLDQIEQLANAFFMALITVMMGGLAWLLWRNGIGFWGASVALRSDGLRLHLPRYRSLIHRPPPVDRLIMWDEISAIETREEGYQSQMMAQLQRPYWLVLNDGTRIFLFEDRGIDTVVGTRSMDPVASAIEQRSGAQWCELPMAEGRGGFLGAWHTAAPSPGAPPLTASRMASLRTRAVITGQLAGIAGLLVLLARVAASVLGVDG